MPTLLRRELRFSQVNANYINKSVGEMISFDIRQYYGHHYFNLHTKIYEFLFPEKVKYSIYKYHYTQKHKIYVYISLYLYTYKNELYYKFMFYVSKALLFT